MRICRKMNDNVFGISLNWISAVTEEWTITTWEIDLKNSNINVGNKF